MSNQNTIFRQNFLTQKEIELLMDYFNNVEWDARMKSRKTLSLGVAYNYSQMSYPQVDIPELFTPILERLETELGFTPNNILCNLYEDGKSSMGWHSDDFSILHPNTGVAIISIGCERTIKFREINGAGGVDIKLAIGSMFYMDDEIQKNYQHCIPKDDSTSPRISMTFRMIL